MSTRFPSEAAMFPKPKARVRDEAYLARVRALPCHVGNVCIGTTEADHQGEHAFGRKGDDRDAVPMCELHHKQRHTRTGYFRRFTKQDMRDWTAAAIASTQARLAENQEQAA